MLERLSFSVLAGLLGFVVLSSLLLLPFGLDADKSPFVFLHIPTVFAQVLFIAAVFVQKDRRQYLATLTGLQRLVLALLFVYVAWVSFISPIESAFFLAMFWLIHIIFFVALICFYRAEQMTKADPIWLILGLAALLHVVAFLTAWAIWPEQVKRGNLPAFENIRFLGYFVAPASAVMAIWFATKRDYALPALVGFLAATFYIIYTGSRGGAIAILAGLIVGAINVGLFRQRIDTRRIVILSLGTGLLIGIAGLLPMLPQWPPLFDRATAVLDQSSTQALSDRDLLWADVAEAISQRWLFGYGPAFVTHVFQFALDPTDIKFPRIDVRNTHNIMLQLLLNWGLIGSLLIVGIALAFARNFWAAMTQMPDRAIFPLVVLATMLVHSLVSGVFFYPYSTIVGIIAFASLTAGGRQEDSLYPNR